MDSIYQDIEIETTEEKNQEDFNPVMDSYEDIREEMNSQKEILKQFRETLSDVLKPDVSDKVLLKWLRAKNYNLKKCEALYRTHIMTRAVYNIDELEETWEVPEVIKKYEFANSLGYAKDGTPVHYVAMGKGDWKGFLLSMDAYTIGKYCGYIIHRDLERCKYQTKKLGKEINEVTYVLDMEEFSILRTLHQDVIEIGLDLFRVFQEQYPEVWKIILVVNAPYYFQAIYNIFKPILGRTLLRKIHVAAKDGTASLLMKYIDEERLPEFLGGKLVDSSGDPMCSEFMKFGGIIPEEYYLSNQTPLMPTDVGVEDVWVPPKCYHNISVVVRQSNSILRVEIRTEGGSMTGLLLYRKFGSDPEILDLPGADEYLDPSDENCNVEQFSPILHNQNHVAPLDNYCFAPLPGIYIFRYGNSYWLTQRRLIYRIRVLPPDV